jgi:hypothetical protein
MDKSELMIGVLDRYDVRFQAHQSGWQTVRCLNEYGHARGDENPSARLNVTLGLFFCNGCGINGDAYNVVMVVENVDFKASLDLVGREAKKEESDWLF